MSYPPDPDGQQPQYGQPGQYPQPDPYGQQQPHPEPGAYGQPPYGGYDPGGAYGQVPPVAPPRFASWPTRVLTYLWDYIVYQWPAWVLLIAAYVLLGVGVGITDGGSEGAGTVLLLVGGIVLLAGLVVSLWRLIRNVMIDQGRTGYTYGRRKTGTRCVREADGLPPGVGSCVGRYFLHILINYACYIDFLWPLWDQRHQTLTDKILTTVVIHDQ